MTGTQAPGAPTAGAAPTGGQETAGTARSWVGDPAPAVSPSTSVPDGRCGSPAVASAAPAKVAAGARLGEDLVPAVALIPLRNRDGVPIAYALVDAEDLPRLSQWRWSFDYRGYALRCTVVAGKQRTFRMHREVLGAHDDPRGVDHLNRNRLDNRKANLRLASSSENNRNRTPVGDALPQSGVRGVRWDSAQRRWAAFVRVGRSRRRIGSYETVDEAVDALTAALAASR